MILETVVSKAIDRLCCVSAPRRTFTAISVSFPEFEHDADQFCPQERVSEFAPQHSDCVEHRLFPALTHPHDGDMAQLLYGEGQRGIGPAAGHAAQSVTGLFHAQLLSGTDQVDSDR